MNHRLRSIRHTALLVSAAALASATTAIAQAPRVETPAPSPLSTVQQRVGLTDIEIVYSRPGVKDREIFGGLLPYDAVWRTGANAPTKIKFSTPVKFQGVDVPAGEYALLSIPGKSEWTVMLTKPEHGNANNYEQKNDVARVKVKPVTLAQPVETFTIDINDICDESATLNLIWEKTRVPVKLEVEVKSKVLAQIDAAMASPEKKSNGLYYNAANFYFNQGLDLNKALEWINAATANPDPAFYMLHLKAKILAKLGQKAPAIAAAKESTERAIKAEGADSGFVKMNADLIASLR